jgi:hypothetical protein
MLKMTCMTCHRFRAEEHIKKLFLVQNKLLDKGLIIAAQKVMLLYFATEKNYIHNEFM